MPLLIKSLSYYSQSMSLNDRIRSMLNNAELATTHVGLSEALDQIWELLSNTSSSGEPTALDPDLKARYEKLIETEEKQTNSFMNHCAAQMGC